MTKPSRLYDEMRESAVRLKERAAGYRFAGERRLARSAQMAADQLDAACAALALLQDRENEK
jgi:hypothetical protein